MPKFTVAELSKKYGIARTSIYDRMKNGTISYEIDDKNRKVIDLSEMQRVYGTPDSKATSKADSAEIDNTTIELYKQLIEELRKDKQDAKVREERMYKEIESLKDKIDNLTLALGYTPLNIQPDSEPDNKDEQNRTNRDLQENVQPETIKKVETTNPSPTLINRFERGIKAFFRK
ncbi:hypothetical protein EXE10_20145 [Acinetobacter sp. WCHAc060033]|uniref:plasmid replication DNA-binding protein n=1 Tax=Acinetobacter sp. WCHAc060033 TaxID=2518624 RepID=UPI001023E48E|nr:plasmid replication DNA-binding protein [Acinetobacter sp. WCHAc060033]RZG76360.1 hypothetical protein EXE10_20145 [Acinetobacter sp. WCHAc060033]